MNIYLFSYVQIHPMTTYKITDGLTNVIFAGPFIYLIGVVHRFQHCAGHITMGSCVQRE